VHVDLRACVKKNELGLASHCHGRVVRPVGRLLDKCVQVEERIIDSPSMGSRSIEVPENIITFPCMLASTG
jgi:hypothetical protein